AFLRRCRPIHASRAARTGTNQPDDSGRWWLWTWLSPRPIWWLPSQRLLRRRVLRRRCGSTGRRGSSRSGGGARGGSSARSASLPSLQRVPMLECLLNKNQRAADRVQPFFYQMTLKSTDAVVGPGHCTEGITRHAARQGGKPPDLVA